MIIGFIGLGAMGKPMAMNLVKSGYSVVVNDVMEDAVTELVKAGATKANVPREVGEKSDVVITMLPNSSIVEAVLTGENGVLEGIKAGATIIDMSSVSPGSTKKMVKLAEAKAVSYLDAPVSGGVAGAAAGKLTIMVGGPDDVVEKCQPILEKMGTKIYHVGQVGTGDAAKIVNNLLLGVNMAAVAEALVLGAKAGLNPETMLEIISVSSGNSYALQAKAEKFIFNGNFEPGFAVDLQYKDLELATQTGKELGVPMVLTNLTQQVYEQARASELGRKDISAIITVLEKMAGVEVRK